MSDAEQDAEAEEAQPASNGEPPVLKKGDVCGGYVIDELIAAGGMAQIYRANHEIMRRVVAVKVLSGRYRGRPDIRSRALSEARALAEVDHANVVRIHHAGEDPTFGPYIVMELLEGKTLRQIMRWGGRIPAVQALGYAIEIADATHALHRVGVIHRDLKPDNIFLTRATPRVLKLLDLGAAKVEKYGNRTTGNFQTIGTAAYMSPEHLDAKKITAASDVYSLGHVVYEMIAGNHAFLLNDGAAPTPDNFARWQRFARPEALDQVVPGITAQAARVIARALEKESADRYPDMKAFADALRAALADERANQPTGEPAKSPPERATPTPEAVVLGLAPTEPTAVAPKGKHGTDLMVPKLSVAEIQAKHAAKSAARATPGGGASGTEVMPILDRAEVVAVAAARKRAAQASNANATPGAPAPRADALDASRGLQHTPPPLTVDDAPPRTGAKIAAALLAGLVIAVFVILVFQGRAQPASFQPAAAAAGSPTPSATLAAPATASTPAAPGVGAVSPADAASAAPTSGAPAPPAPIATPAPSAQRAAGGAEPRKNHAAQ